MDRVDHRRPPAVTVVVRVAEQAPRIVHEAEVHAPRVDPDAGQVVSPGRLAQAAEHLAVEPQDVPVEAIRKPDRLVREAMDLAQVELVGRDTTDHHPAARRAEIHGRDELGSHRRNAAATPASTGMWSPVVWLRSPPVRAKTAAATCSGRTSRLSSVRWA